MRIRAEVIAVETLGDKLAVTFQGKATRESEHYARLGKHVIQVPAGGKNGRTYYVGRIINLEMRPGV